MPDQATPNLDLNFDFLKTLEITPEMLAFLQARMTPQPQNFDIAGNLNMGVSNYMPNGSIVDLGISGQGGAGFNMDANVSAQPYAALQNPMAGLPLAHWIRRDAPGGGITREHGNYKIPGRTSVGLNTGPLHVENVRTDPTANSPSINELRIAFDKAIADGKIRVQAGQTSGKPFEQNPGFIQKDFGASYEVDKSTPSGGANKYSFGIDWNKFNGEKPNYQVGFKYQRDF